MKKNNFIRHLYQLFKGWKAFFRFSPIALVGRYGWFFKQYKKLKKCPSNANFKKLEWYPCLFDDLPYTPLEPTYFFQDSWVARHIFRLKPDHHHDVGSSAMTLGILSQFVSITMIDIRPLELQLEGLSFKRGTILDIPLDDNSVRSISSLCVVEHIGLGRYGDPLDAFGSEKAIAELQRVVKDGGVILISVPVDAENKIYFNAHRVFSRDYIMELFCKFQLLDEQYQYGKGVYDYYDPQKGFGTGMYLFQKTAFTHAGETASK